MFTLFNLIHILNMAPDCCNGPRTSKFPWGHPHCTRWTSCTPGCRSTCPGTCPPSRHAPCPGCCHQWCHRWTWWIQSTRQERRWGRGSLLPDIEVDTVGVIRNETLVFVNFSAQDASILKISAPIIKRSSWGFQNTPNLQNSDYFEPSYCNWKKIEVFQNWFDWLICKSSFCATSFFAVFLANTHQKDDFWGCFGIVRISSCWCTWFHPRF